MRSRSRALEIAESSELFRRGLALAPENAMIHLCYAEHLRGLLEAMRHSLSAAQRSQLLEKARARQLLDRLDGGDGSSIPPAEPLSFESGRQESASQRLDHHRPMG